MKKLLSVGILVALLFVAMPAMAASQVTWYHLYAGQNIHVGDVGVSQGGGNLVVGFDMDEGWYVNETHLAVKQYDSWIPQKKGNPIPGKFQYAVAYEIPENSDADAYVIPMPIYSPMHIAFQADVVHAATLEVGAPAGDALFPPPTIVYDQEEGAWAAQTDPGTLAFGGKNWATYFHYTLPN